MKSPLYWSFWKSSHPGGTHLPSPPDLGVSWPIQAKVSTGPYFLVIQARSWWFMSKDVMHGMDIMPSSKFLPEIVGHFSWHSAKVVVPSCWSKTYMGRMKDVVGAATEEDTAVAASAPRTKEAAAAPATRPLRDVPAGLSATRGVSAGMVE